MIYKFYVNLEFKMLFSLFFSQSEVFTILNFIPQYALLTLIILFSYLCAFLQEKKKGKIWSSAYYSLSLATESDDNIKERLINTAGRIRSLKLELQEKEGQKRKLMNVLDDYKKREILKSESIRREAEELLTKCSNYGQNLLSVSNSIFVEQIVQTTTTRVRLVQKVEKVIGNYKSPKFSDYLNIKKRREELVEEEIASKQEIARLAKIQRKKFISDIFIEILHGIYN